MRKTAMMWAAALAAWIFGVQASADTEYARAMEYLNDRGELYFAIHPDAASDLRFLSRDVSVDRVGEDGRILAYANKDEFKRFLARGLAYEVLTPPCFQTKVTMSDYKEYLRGASARNAGWNTYPTYEAYLQIMAKFQTDHPKRAKLEEIGTSVKERKILALKVSSDVSKSNGKPRMLQISSVHGDELLNYMNTLHIIDTLLSSYGTDQGLTRLVDAIEFWFVPLLNPDGTYKGGNATVQQATRENANNVDVNRNYPCPCGQGGAHAQFGEYGKREPEAAAIIKLYERYYYHLATDLHGGVEVVLLPYASIERKPCDYEWYSWVAKNFVDSARKAGKNGYFTSSFFKDGYTGIYSGLYESHGTSIDYAIFDMRARSIPIENSNIKLPPESELTTYWNYNKNAFFGFYETLLGGIQGTVKNSRTKAPIVAAQVREATHDFDSAYSYTDSAGFYLRFIEKGSWKLTFSKPGYTAKTVTVTVDDYAKKYPLDVELDPDGTGTLTATPPALQPGTISRLGSGVRVDFASVSPDTRVEVYSMSGTLVKRLAAASGSTVFWDGTGGGGTIVRNGCYVVKAKHGAGEVSANIVLSR